MSEFKTLEEAITAFKSLNHAYEALQKEHKALQNEHADANKVVDDLKSKLEEAKTAIPGEVIATVGKQKYRVNFGVKGMKKAEVAEDQKLLGELIKSKSAALTLFSK